MSNVGKWDKFYANLKKPEHYGDGPGYRVGAEWLADCGTVADWGCGKGWFRQFSPGAYAGIDGSKSKFADIVADLATVDHESDGVFMRGVLEHNYDWQPILANALKSARRKLCLVLFTDWSGTDATVELRFEDDYGVPTLALGESQVRGMLDGYTYTDERLPSPQTFYGLEHVFRVETWND